MKNESNIKKELGARIRALRKRHGLTQEEMAEKCDLHWTYIGGLERGERNPTLTTMQRVAAGLSVGLNQLIDARSFPRPQSDEESKEARLLRLIRKKGGDSVELATKVIREVVRWRDRYSTRKS
ncbi:MAG: helix-turn-helix transcriptional regulator [Elusimicrobia bacterium]|jgi:transcriptional regulator with XRE-family HTH domain|nr:helix-turn-helix transcriptional regulator [Elusimicrobiota bacterium]